MTEQQDFYLGFAAVGRLIGDAPLGQTKAKPGDVLILTKPLGTSIATLRWKLEDAIAAEHRDVIEGMLQSNWVASNILVASNVQTCTDVTGYGLLGHLYNILKASSVAATIAVSRLPFYQSLAGVLNPDHSRLAISNFDYVRPHLKRSVQLNSFQEALLFDSQVSGGLLFCAHPNDVAKICRQLQDAGFSPSRIGEVRDGVTGEIELVE